MGVITNQGANRDSRAVILESPRNMGLKKTDDMGSIFRATKTYFVGFKNGGVARQHELPLKGVNEGADKSTNMDQTIFNGINGLSSKSTTKI